MAVGTMPRRTPFPGSHSRVMGLLDPSLLLLLQGTIHGCLGVTGTSKTCKSSPAPGFGCRSEAGSGPSSPGLALGRCCWFLAPGEEEDADGGKGPFPMRVCWRGVAQAGSPEGGGRGRGEMPGRTSQLPGTPQPCPDCQGTAWLYPPLETSPKDMATSPRGASASLGDVTLTATPAVGVPWGCDITGLMSA